MDTCGGCGGRAVEGFLVPPQGWCVVCLLFFDSYEEREDRVRWLRWYLGNVSRAGPEFAWRGMSGW